MTQTQQSFRDYEGFVTKFKPKKTTDDCYTPPEVYKVVKNYVCERWNIEEEQIVRPFYPGGDYKCYGYPEDCVVLDNPPFSILGEIKRFYHFNDIKFFLFAPALTLFNGFSIKYGFCHIQANCKIIYENGANVNTGFVTNLTSDYIVESSPYLHNEIEKINNPNKKALPQYDYPDSVITAARVGYFSTHGAEFKVTKDECLQIEKLDKMPKNKKIFGRGLLLNSCATKKRINAENEVNTNKLKKQKENTGTHKQVFELSEREKQIIQILDKQSEHKND